MGGNRRLSASILTGCGVWLVGLGVYFAALRPILLPEDARFMGTSAEQIRETLPGVELCLRLVFTVVGGSMAGTGVLTLIVAAQPVDANSRGRSRAIGLTGLVSVVAMSAVNFLLGSDFRWLLLVPALLWITAFLLHPARL